MKKAVILFVVAMLTLSPLVFAAQAAGPWEVLARSPGAIESATLNTTGDVCVLEQLRFTRIAPATSNVQTRDLPMSERIFLSPSGSVYAAIAYEGEKDMANAAGLTLHKANGQALWSLSHHPLNDVYPLETGGAIAISRNLNVLENNVYFFSAQGKLLKQLALAAVREVWISPSSDRVVVNSGKDGAILFAASGSEIARLGAAYRLSFSNDGRWVALLYGPKLTLFHDGLAAYTGELDGEIVRGVSFAPDNALFAAFTDHALFLMTNPGGEVLMQKQLDAQSELSFTSVDLTKDAKCIAVGVERDLGESIKGPERHPEGEVRLYNRDGSVCYQMGVAYSRWNTTTPRVKFSADGGQLLVLTRDEVMRATVGSLCGKGGER